MRESHEASNKILLERMKEQLRNSAAQRGESVAQIREALEKQAARIPPFPGLVWEDAGGDGIPGEWIHTGDPEQTQANRVILYLHGGGFVAGSAAVYRDLAARMAKASGTKVLAVNYRLAPEHPYPAANVDCLEAYHALIGLGYPPERIILGGDSVGASLALMTLLSLRDAAEPLPAGAFLLSPHTDLVHLDGESYATRSSRDPVGSREANERILSAYWGNREGDYPALFSPLRSDLSGLPAMLVQVGDEEVLLSDSARFAEAAEAAGVPVRLEIWDHMWSVFQTMAFLLPEARSAIDSIGLFVRERLGLI